MCGDTRREDAEKELYELWRRTLDRLFGRG
jgi:hypothetical protein